jgi:hypothetical protein
MAYYKYTQFLMYEDSPEFDITLSSGTSAPFSGIYYGEVCGRSITMVRSQPLPSLEHHPHSHRRKVIGSVDWLLLDTLAMWVRSASQQSAVGQCPLRVIRSILALPRCPVCPQQRPNSGHSKTVETCHLRGTRVPVEEPSTEAHCNR